MPASDAGRTQPALTRRWLRSIRRVGPPRLAATAIFLLVALLIARYSWSLPLALEAERALHELRVLAMAPKTDPDDRIVLVVYTDDTLIATRKRSPLDRAVLARALASIDAMGARSIGIDILIDQPQDEDAQLLDTFRALRTPTYLAYADAATNRDDIEANQQAFLDSLHRALAGTQVKPASIRLEVEGDNVVRAWPVQPPGLPPLLARAMAGEGSGFDRYTGAIRWRVPRYEDRAVFTVLPIDLFADLAALPPAAAAEFARQLRGRHVLIGGTIKDVDEFETPLRGLPIGDETLGTIYGLEVHAHMLAQMLDKAPLPAVVPLGLWGIALLVVLVGGLSSLLSGAWWRMASFLVLQAAFFGAFPFYLQGRGLDTLGLPAFGWAVGWFIAFAAVGAAARAVGADQRRFAQGALGKYLPRDIANQIMADPDKLALTGEKRAIFVVFTDLEGFTKLSHAIPPETVATLLNRYLDMMSDVVLAHGGTIDKFVGDAVVAFWGAPISRLDDGARAAKAAYAMWQAGEDFRRTVPADVPPIGRTRVGLHYGEAIVGNFGGEGRIQYTALGDAMNTASRLETANKQLGTNVLASREAAERSGLDWWRPLGRVVLRGRATPVDVFEPVPDATPSDVAHIRETVTRLEAGQKDAIADLRALADRSPDDAALSNLVYRFEHIGVGGSYVLE